MKFRTRLYLWYAGALLAALLVLVAHAIYEIIEHSRGKGPGADTELWEVITIELLVGVPLMALGLFLTWWMSRDTLRKLQQLTDAAAGLHAGHLEVNLPPCHPVRDELDRLIEVFRDMAGRLRDSFAQTRDFTLNASHELKTPLTIMRGEVEMELKATPPDPARQAWMESLLEEIDRLARVVDGLSFLAKADAGQIVIHSEPLDFAELVRDTAEDAQLLANPHGLKVELSSVEAPCPIRGDRHRLRQLLLNLADNAVKYNQPGGFVRIRLWQEPGAAVLEIANPGPGIPGGLNGRVFERFFRLDASHSQTIEGSGLGLHIAQWIVQRHAGDIAVATGPDGLTRATVRLPREE
jgi:signal transduction histidine kinase